MAYRLPQYKLPNEGGERTVLILMALGADLEAHTDSTTYSLGSSEKAGFDITSDGKQLSGVDFNSVNSHAPGSTPYSKTPNE